MALRDYKQWFNVSLDEFLVKNDVTEDRVHRNVQYERLKAVTRVDYGEEEFFFFQSTKLKIIYISHGAVADVLWRECLEVFDIESADVTLRSRAGKTSNQLLFGRHGICASINKGQVDFIELFPDCDPDEYMRMIYRGPTKFIR